MISICYLPTTKLTLYLVFDLKYRVDRPKVELATIELATIEPATFKPAM